jgi:hypothetical protein
LRRMPETVAFVAIAYAEMRDVTSFAVLLHSFG